MDESTHIWEIQRIHAFAASNSEYQINWRNMAAKNGANAERKAEHAEQAFFNFFFGRCFSFLFAIPVYLTHSFVFLEIWNECEWKMPSIALYSTTTPNLRTNEGKKEANEVELGY